MKKIPIGVDDFKKIRVEDYFYIDKTKFIEEIFNDGAMVKLFTRPRRFGKTLNMSMLKTFFDIKEAEENRKLFDGLYIKNSSVFTEQGKYPVIFLSMKETQASTFEELLTKTRNILKGLYNKYEEVREKLNKSELQDFDDIWLGNKETDLSLALYKLSTYLKKYYNQNVIVLIDEYDIPLLSAYEYNYYSKAVQFFKLLYGAVLKTNPELKMGVLTGAIRVAQAGIFSDLNNIEVHTILDEDYDEYFGLLENEVEKALNEYDIENKLEDVKSWYNGYRFGNVRVYNPLSILKFLKFKTLDAYWINTSGNILIKNLLLLSDGTVFESLQELLNGNNKMIYLNQSIALGDNLSPNNLWELMLFSGYLTVKEKLDRNTYLVRIPNKEILTFFKDLFVDIVFGGENSSIASMKEALQSRNVRYVVKILEDVILNAMSFYDTSKKYENPYQTLLSGFFYGLDDFYEVKPNVETGYGRADIILVPRNKNWTGYVFELKRAKTENLEKEAKQAFSQIENKKYDTLLKRDGIKDIIKIGLVFDGKKVEAIY